MSQPSATLSSAAEPAHFFVSGIPLHVFGLSSLPPTNEQLTVLFLIHGRTEEKGSFTWAAKKILEDGEKSLKGRLLIVMPDHRNHGERRFDPVQNLAWFDKSGAHPASSGSSGSSEMSNERHALDMYAIQTGTATDVSLLMDFLPAYLFPRGEHQIKTWMVAGVSLGGHSTWIALGNEPRLKYGIPVVGSPNLKKLLTSRAASFKPPLELKPPIWPPQLESLIQSRDPVNLPISTWKGKRILVMGGAKDKLVPHVVGGTEEFVEKLKREGEDVEVDVFVQEGCGHRLSPEMVERMTKWVVDVVANERSSLPLGKL